MKILIVLASVLFGADSLKILGLFPHTGKSHHDVFDPLLEELANRGHQLKTISHFRPARKIEGWTHIDMGVFDSLHRETLDFKMFENNYTSLDNLYHMKETFVIIPLAKKMCDVLTNLPEVRSIVDSGEKFDVVLIEDFNSVCALGVAQFIDAPVVALQSHPPMPWTYARLGQPNFLSYMPVIFLFNGPHMTFLQRIENTLFDYFYNALFKYAVFLPEREIVQRALNRSLPPLDEMAEKIKVLLSNTHFTLHGVKPLVPGIVEVGGMHVKKSSRTLEPEYEKLMNSSKNGVIVFSMGSMLRSSTIPISKRNILLDAFSRIDYDVVWKWEGEPIPDLPKNVFLKKWIPQVELLRHPKTVAFISHGGLLGTTEAIHSGVPMLFIPVFADQGTNSAAAVEAGLGERVPYTHITKENIYKALMKVLSPEMRQSAKDLSMQWHDRIPPLKLASDTVEYVARYKGRHFRSPALDLSTYQIYNLDVYAFILMIVVILLSIILIITRSVFRLCCSRNTLCKETKFYSQNNNKYKKN